MADMPAAPAASASTAPSPTPQQQAHEARARQFIALERFNRKFTLPATDAHEELTVTYAVSGVDSDTAPTVLFVGGMYGGRLLASIFDHVAHGLGIRIVVVDRPGMGGSTIVDVSLRLSIWLETVPVLLRTIKADHVSIAAHSCGAIYALNTIYKLPWVLHPHNRKLYLFSPWVSTEHSGVTMLSISSYLPSPVINKFDSVVRGINSILTPSLHFSSVVSSALSSPSPANQAKASKHERDDICLEYCGVSADENSARSKEIMRAMFKESTSGASHEALLCLRKVPGGWGVCDDYSTYPDALEAKMRESELVSPDNPFVIKTFWAATDMMIGKKGEEYFNKCFERFSQANRGARSDGEGRKSLLFEAEIVPETTHDTVCLPQYDAFPRVLRDMLVQRE